MFKIAIVNRNKLSVKGGAEAWIMNVAKQLSSRGAEIDVISPYDDKIKDTDVDSLNEISYHSTIYNLLNKMRLYNLFYLFVYPKKTVNLERYDVVYTVSFYHSLILLRRTKKTIIGTHDFFITNKKIGIDTLVLPMKIMTNFFLRKKNVYVHCLTSIHTCSLPKKLHSKIYEVGNNFLGEQLFPKYDRNFNVCFLGALIERKGVDVLIDICSLLSAYKDINFYIMGSSDEKFSSLLRSLRINNIKYLGYVSEDEKRRILSISQLMLMLSTRESFPIVAVEGLSSGLKILTTWRPLSEIHKGYPIIYCEKTANDIVSKIVEIKKEWSLNKDDFFRERQIRASKFYVKAQQDIAELLNMFY